MNPEPQTDMGQILRTEAVVLRNMDYRETSQIVTLFTREKGKVAVLAKGARRAKSQFGATLQPMAHIQALIYHKPSREIQTLGETSHVTLFNRIGKDLDKLSAGVRMVELVQALLQVEEENEQVFRLLVDTLHGLDRAEHRMDNLWPFFRLKLAGILGFDPYVRRGDIEGIEGAWGYLSLETGAITKEGAIPGGNRGKNLKKASRTALRAFAVLARTDLDVVMRMQMDPPVLHEVSSLIDAYLQFHLEEALPTRTGRVIGQLQDVKKDA